MRKQDKDETSRGAATTHIGLGPFGRDLGVDASIMIGLTGGWLLVPLESVAAVAGCGLVLMLEPEVDPGF